MKFQILIRLEKFFGWIVARAESARERCAVCPCCGENRYTGKPCQNL